MGQTVAILGASVKADRFSNKAFHLLRSYGHQVIPVAPQLKEVEGVPAKGHLSEIDQTVDTLTMYVGPQRSNEMKEEILALHPKRVIFNPGSENPELAQALQEKGVEVVNACTLVMLREGLF